MAVIRTHPTIAYDMLKNLGFPKPALEIPYCHHEKWDGTGYPRGLKGKQIPFFCPALRRCRRIRCHDHEPFVPRRHAA